MVTRLGIIGTGRFSEQHINAINWVRNYRNKDVQIVAAQNRSPISNERAKNELMIPRTYTCFRQMIEEEELDGLIVTVPADSLYEVVVSLIPYKIPLLMEKPPGITLNQSKHLKKLASEYETSILVGFNRRFYSIVNQAKQIISQSGGLLGLRMDCFERYRMYRENDIVEKDILERLLTTNSIHCIDLIREYVGDIKETNAFLNLKTAEPYNHRYSALLVSETNIPVTFQAYWHSYGNWNYELYFVDGKIQFSNMEEATVFIRDKKPFRLIPSIEDIEVKPGMVSQIDYFLENVLGSNNYNGKSSIYDAIKTIELIDQINSTDSRGD